MPINPINRSIPPGVIVPLSDNIPIPAAQLALQTKNLADHKFKEYAWGRCTNAQLISTISACMEFALEKGRPHEAGSYFMELKDFTCTNKPELLNLSLRAFHRQGKSLQVIQAYEDLIEQGAEICPENYEYIMKAFKKMNVSRKILEVYSELLAKNIVPGTVICQINISVCKKEHLWEGAMNIYTFMTHLNIPRNKAIYQDLISLSLQAGDWITAQNLYYNMPLDGIEPDQATFNLFLT